MITMLSRPSTPIISLTECRLGRTAKQMSRDVFLYNDGGLYLKDVAVAGDEHVQNGIDEEAEQERRD